MSYTLTADSGSTKTHWVIVNGKEIIREFYTQGINPYYISSAEIKSLINDAMSLDEIGLISKVDFYGAGCKGEEMCSIVETALLDVFNNVIINVDSDLMGSALSLFSNGNGIACILGTGSNAAVFIEGQFVDSISSLGYILGDEGSGSYLGKILIRDYFQKKMPIELEAKFKEKFSIEYSQVLNSVYKKRFPNKYLAKYTVFLSENRGKLYIENVLTEAFEAFVKNQLSVLNFDKEILKVGFVGSIAFYFKDVLEKVLIINSYKIGDVYKEPMDGLIKK